MDMNLRSRNGKIKSTKESLKKTRTKTWHKQAMWNEAKWKQKHIFFGLNKKCFSSPKSSLAHSSPRWSIDLDCSLGASLKLLRSVTSGQRKSRILNKKLNLVNCTSVTSLCSSLKCGQLYFTFLIAQSRNLINQKPER